MKDIQKEAREFFSHNPQAKRVGFVMVDDYELDAIEKGETLWLDDKDITIIENPEPQPRS